MQRLDRKASGNDSWDESPRGVVVNPRPIGNARRASLQALQTDQWIAAMKLYYWPRTRAFRALWMLEELQVPYEFAYVNIRAGEQNDPPFCHVNPMSKVPALEDDGAYVAESGAVLLYLADKYPDVLRWISFIYAAAEAVSYTPCTNGASLTG
jgi:Glutathione S-transferase, N-terminal domain